MAMEIYVCTICNFVYQNRENARNGAGKIKAAI